MAQAFDVVTVGSVIRDITMFTAQGRVFKTPDNLTAQRVIGFEYGAKVKVSNAHFSSGGGAGNAAVTFQSLGLRTAIFTRVGADAEGAHLCNDLRRYGVSTNFLQFDEHQPTQVALAGLGAVEGHLQVPSIE